MHDLFGKMDDDTSGSISKEEMKNAFKEMKINLDDPLFDEFFSDFDPNGDGSLDYEEFLTQMRTHIHGGQGVVKRTSTMKKEKKAQKTEGGRRGREEGAGRNADADDISARHRRGLPVEATRGEVAIERAKVLVAFM